MNFIEEFRKAGLIKSEAYIDKSSEADAVSDKNEMGTTTGTVAVAAQPLTGKEQEGEDITTDDTEGDGEKKLLINYDSIVECAVKLAETYHKLSGKQMHEMFCPNCKPYDISPATPDKGEKFGPTIPGQGPDVRPSTTDYGK